MADQFDTLNTLKFNIIMLLFTNKLSYICSFRLRSGTILLTGKQLNIQKKNVHLSSNFAGNTIF